MTDENQMEIDEVEHEMMLMEESPHDSFGSNQSEDFFNQNFIGFDEENADTATSVLKSIQNFIE